MPTVPLLGNVADLASSQTAQTTVPLMPTGSVISYAGSTAPTGWLLCDGASLSTTTYASLFAVIGYAFGGSGGSFNLPDLRGRFVRYDNNMGNHGIAGVTAAGPASIDTGRSHGSTQTQATKTNGITVSGGTASLTGSTTFSSSGHQHNSPIGEAVGSVYYKRAYGLGDVVGINTSGAGITGSSNVDAVHLALTSGPSSTAAVGISSTAASLGSGDVETRPLNIALNAIIKI